MPEFSVKVRMVLEGTAIVEAASKAAVEAMWPFDIIRPDDEFFITAELVDYKLSNIKPISD